MSCVLAEWAEIISIVLYYISSVFGYKREVFLFFFLFRGRTLLLAISPRLKGRTTICSGFAICSYSTWAVISRCHKTFFSRLLFVGSSTSTVYPVVHFLCYGNWSIFQFWVVNCNNILIRETNEYMNSHQRLHAALSYPILKKVW